MEPSTLSQPGPSIELQNYHVTAISEEGMPKSLFAQGRNTLDIERAIVVQQLKPADGGPAAWKLLIAAFVFEALLWGMNLCIVIVIFQR
jgi:hypothetical protein